MAKAELGYNYRGMFGSIETCRDDPKGLTDDGNFYLCIPVAEAREFLKLVIRAVGLVKEPIFSQRLARDRAREYQAKLPEEEK